MKNIAIFGFQDSLVGQVINFLPLKLKKKIKCIIILEKPKKINYFKKTEKREFIIKNRIYNLPVIISKNFIEVLKRKKIKKVFILEYNKKLRSRIFNEIKKKIKTIKILTFIAKNSYLAGKNFVGEGSIIFPLNYIAYKTNIGVCSIVQSNCLIEHHSNLGSFCNINPRLSTGGFVKIEDFCEIGMNVTLINGLTIKKKTQIGAGSLLLSNTKSNGLYYGRPATYKKKTTIER